MADGSVRAVSRAPNELGIVRDENGEREEGLERGEVYDSSDVTGKSFTLWGIVFSYVSGFFEK